MDSWVLPLALVVIAALAFTLQRMRHTQRQLSLAQRLKCNRAVDLPIKNELDFLRGACRTLHPVGLARRQELAETILRVMEMRDRLMQGLGGKITQQVLKMSERPRRGCEQLRRRALEAVRALDEGHDAPDLAGGIGEIGLAVTRGQQAEGLAGGIAAIFFDSFA